MAYTKTVWVDGSAPSINADNLNKIEDGIAANDANKLSSIVAGNNISVDNTDPTNPVISSTMYDDSTLQTEVTANTNKLNGIEANAAADQTPAELLAAIKTVDGSGSGLDADTIRGLTVETAVPAGAVFTDTITDVSGKADKAQDVNTTTAYTDSTTSVQYKMYMDNGTIIMEEI